MIWVVLAPNSSSQAVALVAESGTKKDSERLRREKVVSVAIYVASLGGSSSFWSSGF